MGKTSSQVKQRYNQKTYKLFGANISKELAESFTEQLKKDRITKAEFIRNAIENYLKKPWKSTWHTVNSMLLYIQREKQKQKSINNKN